MKDFFENSFAKIYYDDVLDVLFLEYTHKVPNEAAFIEVNQGVLDAFLTLNTQLFVADIRKMGIISPNSQKWVVDHLLPGMFKHLQGKILFHAQWIDRTEIMSKVSASNIKNNAKKVNEQFEVVQVTNREELVQYIEDCKKDIVGSKS